MPGSLGPDLYSFASLRSADDPSFNVVGIFIYCQSKKVNKHMFIVLAQKGRTFTGRGIHIFKPDRGSIRGYRPKDGMIHVLEKVSFLKMGIVCQVLGILHHTGWDAGFLKISNNFFSRSA